MSKARIPVVAESAIDCSSCVGACCQNITAVFNYEEARQLEEAGTQIVTILDATPISPSGNQETYDWGSQHEALVDAASNCHDANARGLLEVAADASMRMQPGDGYFKIIGRCGNLLADATCAVYQDRPNICKTFEMGGPGCLVMRETVSTRFTLQDQAVNGPMAGSDYGNIVRVLLELYK